MATLITDVQSRFSSDLLVKLTNIDAPAVATVNTAFLQTVCDDVQSGEFEAFINETYDATNRRHVIFACLLVKLKCIEYGAAADESAAKLRERVEKLGEALRQIGARDRISPKSSSDLTPSSNQGTGPFRPEFDDLFFERIIPEDTSSDRDSTTGLPLP